CHPGFAPESAPRCAGRTPSWFVGRTGACGVTTRDSGRAAPPPKLCMPELLVRPLASGRADPAPKECMPEVFARPETSARGATLVRPPSRTAVEFETRLSTRLRSWLKLGR